VLRLGSPPLTSLSDALVDVRMSIYKVVGLSSMDLDIQHKELTDPLVTDRARVLRAAARTT
jgi:hypothetical protein